MIYFFLYCTSLVSCHERKNTLNKNFICQPKNKGLFFWYYCVGLLYNSLRFFEANFHLFLDCFYGASMASGLNLLLSRLKYGTYYSFSIWKFDEIILSKHLHCLPKKKNKTDGIWLSPHRPSAVHHCCYEM